MKKKIFGLLLMASLAISSAAYADENPVKVVVDNRTIGFTDQEPIIEADSVLVPVRGVFEAMDSKVQWFEEDRQVVIYSADNLSRVVLTIDKPEIRTVKLISLTEAEINDVPIIAAPTIVNDRTMLPLRAIMENIDADVAWDEDTRTVSITSKRLSNTLANIEAPEGATVEDVIKASVAGLSLRSDAEDIKVGDTVTVKVNLNNSAIYSDSSLFGATAGVLYDKESFTYTGYKVLLNGAEVEPSAVADNSDFFGDSIKFAYLYDPKALEAPTDSTLFELYFTVTDEKGGEFVLSDRYTDRGFDSSVIIFDADSDTLILGRYDEVYIDKTPLTISSAETETDETVE